MVKCIKLNKKRQVNKFNLYFHKKKEFVRAMKMLKKRSLINEDEKQWFAELNILKNLDHPNIVKLHELF